MLLVRKINTNNHKISQTKKKRPESNRIENLQADQNNDKVPLTNLDLNDHNYQETFVLKKVTLHLGDFDVPVDNDRWPLPNKTHLKNTTEWS